MLEAQRCCISDCILLISISILLTVMEVQTVNAGYKKEVVFPSQDVQEQPPGDQNFLNERIILSPKLFENQGKYIVLKRTSSFIFII